MLLLCKNISTYIRKHTSLLSMREIQEALVKNEVSLDESSQDSGSDLDKMYLLDHPQDPPPNVPTIRKLIEIEQRLNYEKLKCWRYNTKKITKIEFINDLGHFCMGTLDGHMIVYDAIHLEKIYQFTPHSRGGLVDYCWSMDSEYVLTASTIDHSIKLWQPSTKEKINTFYLGVSPTSVAFNPINPNQFIAGDILGNIYVYNVSNSRKTLIQSIPNSPVSAIQFGIVTSELWLIIAAASHILVLEYNFRNGEYEISKTINNLGCDITSIKFLDMLPGIIVTCSDGMIRLMNIPQLHTIREYRINPNTANICSDIPSDGKYLVSGSEDGNICIFSPRKDSKLLKQIKVHKRPRIVNTIAISDDHKYIVSGSKGGIACLYQLTVM
eukprot:TRINITY_DN1670_c0_g1_i2.p1 TRINITY_DN1670_c0_g1~~TRINITY_DN1670_c0_g1_i2.p1  ORF type:complete len:383 (-),score=45.93 TRINITY_DN1670_c0_g1_i2:29-1177(-)